MSVLVSVLMPVRNAEKTLQSAVSSILSQAHGNLQFIIVDDFSDDNSLEILKSINDDRITVISNTGEPGISGALNTGLEYVRGQFIARMDADDRCDKFRLSRQLKFLQKHTDVDVCGTAVKTSLGDVRVYPESHDDIAATLLFENAFAHPTVMFRTDAIKKCQLGYDSSMNGAEDYKLWIDYSKILHFANIPQIGCYYFIKESGQQKTDDVRTKLADELRVQMLSNLGLEPSREERQLHCRIGRWELQNDSVIDIEHWFRKIEHENDRSNIFEPSALNQSLKKRMFRLVNLMEKYDKNALFHYKKSHYRDDAIGWQFREFALQVKFFKRALLGVSA